MKLVLLKHSGLYGARGQPSIVPPPTDATCIRTVTATGSAQLLIVFAGVRISLRGSVFSTAYIGILFEMWSEALTPLGVETPRRGVSTRTSATLGTTHLGGLYPDCLGLKLTICVYRGSPFSSLGSRADYPYVLMPLQVGGEKVTLLLLTNSLFCQSGKILRTVLTQRRLLAIVGPLFMCILPACVDRPAKPLVLTGQKGLPVPLASQSCQIPLLKTAPSEPYEVIARVKTYGNPETDQAEMNDVLYREACAIDAQAVIIEQMKEAGFDDETSAPHVDHSNLGDSSSTAKYARQIVGIAIRYKSEPAPKQ